MKKIIVQEHAPLLEFLFRQLAAMKKTKVKQMLKFGSVRINGKTVTRHNHLLKPGDTIDLISKHTAAAERFKEELEFDIVYEDSDVIVVEKPAGLLTMGTETEKEDTLYFKLTEYQRTKKEAGRNRIFIVHRLDRDASGLIVFAKTETAKITLQKNWHRAVKKYYAITEGCPAKKEGTIKSYLEEDDFQRVFSTRKTSPDAKPAVTHYKVLEEDRRFAFLELTLETGRKNQIRVHLADLGHPITGDEKYGAKTNPLMRLALHAYFLSFPHPTTREMKTFTSKIAGHFKNLFAKALPAKQP